MSASAPTDCHATHVSPAWGRQSLGIRNGARMQDARRRLMEESRNVGGIPLTSRTTGKLPPENAANNITATPSNSNQQKQGNQAPASNNTLQLVVIEGFQVGRGVARIDPNDMLRLGCQPGDIIMINGARTTAAKVVPNGVADRGQQSIQMDSQVRQNSASGLGERVTIHKARVSNAEKITLLPLTGG